MRSFESPPAELHEPTSRTTPCVHERYGDKLGLLNAKVDPVRKSSHRCTSDIVVNDGMLQGMLGQAPKRSEGFVEEFGSETCTLLFVPRSGCRQVSIRLFRESDRAIHSFFLISAMTSSAGRLCRPLAS